MTRIHEIRLTELDAVRLERAVMEVLKASPVEPQGAAELEALLDNAAIVPSASIGPGVVKLSLTSQASFVGQFQVPLVIRRSRLGSSLRTLY